MSNEVPSDDSDQTNSSRPSESSMLERIEKDLRDGLTLGDSTETNLDSAAAETLIRLNETFSHNTRSTPTQIDRFEIREELGRGQFGIVYLAWDPKLKREVAVKVAAARVLNDAALRQRFQRETELVARLNHPGLVRIHEVGEVDGTPFYVMPVAEGISLRQWLNQQAEPVPLRQAVQVVIDIAEAMQHGHDTGIIHRDLKPSNVMIRPADDSEAQTWNVCVLDFGLATFADPQLRETEGGMLLGTPMYMSPEQAEGRRDEVGTAADQFSLGNLLYELITGQAAFQADHLPEMGELFRLCSPIPPTQLRPECGSELESVCQKCLQRNPVDRYASMSDLAHELRIVQNGGVPKALQERQNWQAATRWLKAPRRISQSLLLVAVFGCCVYFYVQRDRNVSIARVANDDSAALSSVSQSPASVADEQVASLTANAADQRDRRLAEFVTTHGGSVEVRTGGKHFELHSTADLPEGPIELLWIMMLENKHATDDFVAQLQDLKSLEGIDLYAAPITDSAAKYLAAIPTLANVYLHETAITDAGAVSVLSLPSLEELNLSHTSITDVTLQACGRHPHLQRLNVGETDITDVGFCELIKAPALTEMDVSFTHVTDVAFGKLSARTDLREICFAGTQVTSQHFEIVMQHTKLRHLECSPDFFGKVSLREFRKQRPLCEVRLR